MTNPADRWSWEKAARDALGEFANVGSGNGISSLGKMLNDVRLVMSLPEWTRDRKIAALPGMGLPGLAVGLSIHGSFDGRILLMLDEPSALQLAGLLLKTSKRLDSLGPAGESALLEAGNIVVSSYLSATSRLIGVRALPTPPDVMFGPLQASVRKNLEPFGDVPLIGVSNTFEDQDGTLTGRIMLVLSEDMATVLLKTMGIRAGR